MALSNVVLANFSISSPRVPKGPIMWPTGMLAPGPQPGGSGPRKLQLSDVKIVVTAEAIQDYVRFFQETGTLVYTVRLTTTRRDLVIINCRCLQ